MSQSDTLRLVAEFKRVHTAQGLREEAERCFRLAAGTLDQKLSDELLAYGRELAERAEKMQAMEKAATKPTPEHKGLS